MLQIRLNKPSAEGGGALKSVPVETVTVACPDHLVLADLPVAKGIGGATSTSLVKTVGRRSRRQLGERVHFCVCCDFPIAIYGRLSPCEHAFCLDCARSDSICYLCDERIQKIQAIKMMEGIFICAAPHCLKSFLNWSEFESHIQESHADLLHPNADKEVNESEGTKQATDSESTAGAPPRQVFSPLTNAQLPDSEDKARHQQPPEQPSPRQILQPNPSQIFGQIGSHPSESQLDPQSQGLPNIHNHFQQQTFDAQSAPQQEFGQFSDRPQGMPSDSPFPEYPPMQPVQMPTFSMPTMMPSPFGFPFPTGGAQAFYGTPYEIARQNSATEVVGPAQGSLLGYPPGSAGMANFPANYPPTWNPGPAGVPFDASATSTGATNSQGKQAFYRGDYGRNTGVLPLNHPTLPLAGKGMEGMQLTGNLVDSREPLPLPPSQAHTSHHKRGKNYSSDAGRDGQGFGWQHDSFSRQD